MFCPRIQKDCPEKKEGCPFWNEKPRGCLEELFYRKELDLLSVKEKKEITDFKQKELRSSMLGRR